MKKCCRCKEIKDYIDYGILKKSKDGYRHDCKDCRKLYSKSNCELIANYKKEYYLKNKSSIDVKNKKWYVDNLESKKEYDKNRYLVNKDKISISYKKWRNSNLESIREYKRKYYNEVTSKDPIKKLKHSIRASIRQSFTDKGFYKTIKTNEILGCSYEEFEEHLESKFEAWMNWENHGKYNGELNYGWDIDHIIPLSSAINKEEIITLSHFTNLQPLCSKVNRCIKRNHLYDTY